MSKHIIFDVALVVFAVVQFILLLIVGKYEHDARRLTNHWQQMFFKERNDHLDTQQELRDQTHKEQR